MSYRTKQENTTNVPLILDYWAKIYPHLQNKKGGSHIDIKS